MFTYGVTNPERGTWILITPTLLIRTQPSPFSLLTQKKEKKLTQISELVFRFESFIIFVECRDLDSAQKLVSLAIACGFKEFGITSVSKRVIVGIRCSIRFKVPLGDTQKIIIIYGIHWTVLSYL